jgi:hypothetical protein
MPRSFSDEESAFQILLTSHNSRFLAPLEMTPEMMVEQMPRSFDNDT